MRFIDSKFTVFECVIGNIVDALFQQTLLPEHSSFFSFEGTINICFKSCTPD